MTANSQNLARRRMLGWSFYIGVVIVLAPLFVALLDIRYNIPIYPRYIVPLARPYLVEAMPSWPEGFGPFELVTATDERRLSWEPLGGKDSDTVQNLESLQSGQNSIFGKTTTGYFVLNVRTGEVSTYTSIEVYLSALKSLGIEDIHLSSPEELARGVPENVKRPWEYAVMRGRLGISDTAWSVIIDSLGWSVALMVGLLSPMCRTSGICLIRYAALCLFGMIFGVIVDYIADIWMIDSATTAYRELFFIVPIFALSAIFSKGCQSLLVTVLAAFVRIAR